MKIQYIDHRAPVPGLAACFPIKIRAASAGWTRAVAIFEDQDHV